MQKLRKLPLGIQSFEYLRQNDYIYMDKTELIYKLASLGKAYFLSRPRRFGKSLLITTMEAYFLGKKELFKGLSIEHLEKDWLKYPVLKFSLAGGDFTSPKGLYNSLSHVLSNFEETYSLPSKEVSLPERFKDALKNAYKATGLRVIVLVDEYDNSLLKTVDYPEQEQKNREFFKGFFASLKDMDEYLHFVFFTGVTKFSKVSIFSDINQLTDISMDKAYSTICGITQDELEKNFIPEIEALSSEINLSKEECLNKLKQMYDGYKFSANGTNVYNPYSLLCAFNYKEFGSYWFESGTPTFLINKLKNVSYNIKNFTDNVEATALQMHDYRMDNPNPIPLLYQSGYLTIKSYDSEFETYTLSYPNDEVKYAFTESLAPYYLELPEDSTPFDIRVFGQAIKKGNIDEIINWLKGIFAILPYTNDRKTPESRFQDVIYMAFLMEGKYARTEVHSAKGRANCIVETDDYIYIFEFKVDGSVQEALNQIEQKGYAIPFSADKRKLFKIAVNFSTEERNIDAWKVG